MAENGTIAYIDTPKMCDFPHPSLPGNLGAPGRVEARYDFKTKQGPWANGCTDHYFQHRLYGELGMGKGQRLQMRKVETLGKEEAELDRSARNALKPDMKAEGYDPAPEAQMNPRYSGKMTVLP